MRVSPGRMGSFPHAFFGVHSTVRVFGRTTGKPTDIRENALEKRSLDRVPFRPGDRSLDFASASADYKQGNAMAEPGSQAQRPEPVFIKRDPDIIKIIKKVSANGIQPAVVRSSCAPLSPLPVE